jgi:amino acid permease
VFFVFFFLKYFLFINFSIWFGFVCFVGSWLHCGYHLTTSIVGPVILTLPFSFTLLGWFGGIIWLVLAGVITFYSYNLLSIVLEHHAQLGRRQLRFRDMTRDILGEFTLSFSTLLSFSLLFVITDWSIIEG